MYIPWGCYQDLIVSLYSSVPVQQSAAAYSKFHELFGCLLLNQLIQEKFHKNNI